AHSEPLDSAVPLESGVTPVSNGPGAGRHLLFIDSSVDGWQQIVASVREDIDVVMLDPDQDALEQIAGRIKAGATVDAVHIISHGSEGVLMLGGKALDLAALPGEAAWLADIRAGLADDADILLYGCNIGQGESGAALLA